MRETVGGRRAEEHEERVAEIVRATSYLVLRINTKMEFRATKGEIAKQGSSLARKHAVSLDLRPRRDRIGRPKKGG